MNDSVERGCFYSTKGNIWHASRVPPSRVGGCILFLRMYTRCTTVILIGGNVHISRRDTQISPINLIYTINSFNHYFNQSIRNICDS